MAIYIDDRELVAAHQAGDSEAFDELVREFRGPLLRHAKRKLYCDLAAEDALQETLVRAYKALPAFDGDYRLGPWLHRIMANVCVDEANRRRKDGEKTVELSSQPSTRSDSPSVETVLGLETDDTDLKSALDELPTLHRDALLMKFVDELNYSELAQASGVSEQNARARVSRARSAMRAALKGVAALPVLLVGVLKRGEKAAAAASSTGVMAVSSGASSTSVAVQSASLASATMPTIAEASAVVTQVAPSVVPVIAKAAVGIGLAAAVLTPTDDSAMHQAFDNFANGTTAVIAEVNIPSEDLEVKGSVSVEAPVSSIDSVSSESALEERSESQQITSADVPGPLDTERLRSDRLTTQILQGAGENDTIREVTGPLLASRLLGLGIGQVVTVTSTELESSLQGPGRMALSGALSYVLQDSTVTAQLDAASHFSWGTSSEGRTRFDSLMSGALRDGSNVELRLAGFSSGLGKDSEIGGVFLLDSGLSQPAIQGTFSGFLVHDDGLAVSQVSVTLNP